MLGLYTAPAGQPESRLIHTYNPQTNGASIEFGKASNVGTGGMDSKVKAALWALDHGVAPVIANGFEPHTVTDIVGGKRVGTFFTNASVDGPATELQAVAGTPKFLTMQLLYMYMYVQWHKQHVYRSLSAREGSRRLLALKPEQRARIIYDLAEILLEHEHDILNANKKDLNEARSAGLSTLATSYERETVKLLFLGLAAPLISRLVLSSAKIRSLVDGLRQIADASEENVGRVLKRTLLADGMRLKQVTVPIGVLLVVFEARPDCLPQVPLHTCLHVLHS